METTTTSKNHIILEFIYSMIFDMIAYMVAARSLIDEILYKLGFKRRFNVKEEFKGRLNERVAIVTGGTRGLGLTVVKELLVKGCLVIVATSQNPDKFSSLEMDIRKDLGMKYPDKEPSKYALLFHWLDLSNLDSVQRFVESFKIKNFRLDYLICNAGIMFAPKKMTADGLESHFAVNYFGHCVLIMELLQIMRETAKKFGTNSRIISVSSSTHKVTKFKFNDPFSKEYYSSSQAYAQSKLAQIMFSAKLSRIVNSEMGWKNVQTISLHPGVILSDLYEHVRLIQYFPFLIPLIKCVTRTMEEGAETTLYAALSSELDGKTGVYLEDCAVSSPSSYSMNEDNQTRLWNFTERLFYQLFEPLNSDGVKVKQGDVDFVKWHSLTKNNQKETMWKWSKPPRFRPKHQCQTMKPFKLRGEQTSSE